MYIWYSWVSEKYQISCVVCSRRTGHQWTNWISFLFCFVSHNCLRLYQIFNEYTRFVCELVRMCDLRMQMKWLNKREFCAQRHIWTSCDRATKVKKWRVTKTPNLSNLVSVSVWQRSHSRCLPPPQLFFSGCRIGQISEKNKIIDFFSRAPFVFERPTAVFLPHWIIDSGVNNLLSPFAWCNLIRFVVHECQVKEPASWRFVNKLAKRWNKLRRRKR